MAHALEAMAQKDLSNALRPLQESVARAVPQIETCHSDLARMSLERASFCGSFFCWIVYGRECAGMTRCTLGDRVAEAERYELLGRTVEKRIAQHTPENQQKIHNWINGIETAEPKRASWKGHADIWTKAVGRKSPTALTGPARAAGSGSAVAAPAPSAPASSYSFGNEKGRSFQAALISGFFLLGGNARPPISASFRSRARERTPSCVRPAL